MVETIGAPPPAQEPSRNPRDDAMLAGPYAEFWRPRMAALPEHVVAAVAAGPLPPESLLDLAAAPTLLDPGDWPVETGYTLGRAGDARIFVRTHMPRVTPAMWEWWFAWHGSRSVRYRLWHPQAHIAARWEDGFGELPTFVGRTSLVDEYIGATLERLAIRFVAPPELGFDPARLGEAAGQIVICARGSRRNAPVDSGWLVHHVRAVDGGSEMRSRFWLGGPHVDVKRNWGPVGRVAAAAIRRVTRPTRDDAADLLVHCAQEMNHLAAILPELHAIFGPSRDGEGVP